MPTIEPSPAEPPQRQTWSDVPWKTIVGVIGNIRHAGPDNPANPEAFRPLAQDPAQGALVVVERSARTPQITWPSAYTSERSRRYGETRVDLGEVAAPEQE